MWKKPPSSTFDAFHFIWLITYSTCVAKPFESQLEELMASKLRTSSAKLRSCFLLFKSNSSSSRSGVQDQAATFK